ncbi:MAG TPA: L,D-transpeptidase family protein [Sphingomicrobium sp.]|nr:L,D-transpeptidase family protein [Sphingomicrobium sp.]
MKRLPKSAIAAAALASLAGCSTAPKPKLAEAPPPPRVASIAPYTWSLGEAPQAHRDMVAEFGKAGLKPGQYLWAASIPAEGEVRVVIDRLTQMAYVYKGDELIGATTVSTAKQGHITPLGQWSVLEKRPFYRSKKYDNAPMPWMERIDEYGIALHGGGTPGYPESHGCIHLPMKFAEKLYGLTKIGTKVVIEG